MANSIFFQVSSHWISSLFDFDVLTFDFAFTMKDKVLSIDLSVLLPRFMGDGLGLETLIGVFMVALRLSALAFLW